MVNKDVYIIIIIVVFCCCYLSQGGCVFASVCLSVSTTITQKVVDEF